jgi:hypothetical protein
METTYEQDIVAWANEQANLLRAGRFDGLDITHIAEEIEDVGKSEQRELASRMTVLLAHLLKWQFQPERQCVSWEVTIKGQRERIAKRLKKTPSLQYCLSDPEWWDDAWFDAIIEAAKEIGIGINLLPQNCPWSTTDILNPDWKSD